MPPGGQSSTTVSDDVFEQLGVVMAEYDCDNPAEGNFRRTKNKGGTWASRRTGP